VSSYLRFLVLLAVCVGPVQAQSRDSTPARPTTVTFTPGLRLQVRYAYDNVDANNDFFIARTRLKVKGDVFGVGDYLAEIKLDNVGRFARDVNAQVENAWLDFPVRPAFAVRVGLYDAVFSRNALTSDSKLLLMDRSLIKDQLTTLGLADNTVGVLVHGRPFGGRAEYSAGLFDNLQFEQATSPTARQADGAMIMGRLVVNLLDPATPSGGYADYQSSYLGRGRRLALGANVAYLSKAREGTQQFDIDGWGADLFFNTGPLTVEAEYDRYEEAMIAGANPDVLGHGWYVQGGYLLYGMFELAARYQGIDPNKSVTGDRLRWTSVGFNIYLRQHGLKVQTDYTFKREQGSAVQNDAFQSQLQLDF
jgi:phosphate-selective porin